MQAIILAAGKSSRFYPFNTKHKSFFQLMGRPIVEHTLLSIKKSGIRDVILVVHDIDEAKDYFGDGQRLDMNISYCLQSEPLGMGDAILKAKDQIRGDFFVLSGHRLDFADYADKMQQQKKDEVGAVVLVTKTDDVSEFGEVLLDNDKVVSITEKPEKIEDKSGFRLLSTYLLSSDFFQQLESTSAGEYNFETALSDFAKAHEVKAVEVEEESFSLKYSWNLFDVKKYLFAHQTPIISSTAQIASTARIIGDVVIGDNTKILEHAVVKGPCYIGDNTVVGDFTLIRGETVLESNVVIGVFSEVKNAVIQSGTHMHSGYIGDSIVGGNCRIGGKFSTSNRRLDRAPISIRIGTNKINSGLTSLGAIIGEEVSTGVDVISMPGIVIGNNVIIGPSTTVMENIDDGTLFYTEYSNVVKKNTRE